MSEKLTDMVGSSGVKYERTRTERVGIKLVNEDGQWKISGYDVISLDDSCDGSTIPIGLFDPAPVVPTSGPTKPVRPPLFWDDNQ